jgi:Protein of unknown function (DUF3307)
MGGDTALVLGALLAFEIKHFLCDFVLQTAWQVRTKGIYGHAGGFVHAGLHILGSIPALLILGCGIETAAIILIVEFAVHYHMDWAKANIDRIMQWGHNNQRYWMLFGTDQLVHQLTYLGIVYVVAAGFAA